MLILPSSFIDNASTTDATTASTVDVASWTLTIARCASSIARGQQNIRLTILTYYCFHPL